MTLLQQMDAERAVRRERLRLEARDRLKVALLQLRPAPKVILFGSIAQPGRFNEYSDVDLALENAPEHMSVYQLTSLLAEAIGRPVDVILLDECRFREKILREGETWMLLD